MALGSNQPLTEMSTRSISWGKGGRCVRLTTLPPSCAVVTKSGNLNFLEPSGQLQACNGTDLPFYCATTALGTGDGTSPHWSLLMRHLLRTHVGFGCNEIGQSFSNSDPQTCLVWLCERHCILSILVTRVLRFSQRRNWDFPSPAI